jgi:hypothetical protein
VAEQVDALPSPFVLELLLKDRIEDHLYLVGHVLDEDALAELHGELELVHEVDIAEVEHFEVLLLHLDPLVGLVLWINANALLPAVVQDDAIADGEAVTGQAVEVPLLDLDLVPEYLVEVEVIRYLDSEVLDKLVPSLLQLLPVLLSE